MREEMRGMSAERRQRIIGGFIDRVFDGVDDEDALVLAGFMREMPATPPDELTADQVDAWVELAGLVGDADFEATLRRMARTAASDRRIEFGLNIRPVVLEYAGAAVRSGVAPESDDGQAVLNRIVPSDLTAGETVSLLEWLDTVTDARVERYWLLLSRVNGYGPGRPTMPAFRWLRAAVRAHRAAAAAGYCSSRNS